MLTRLFAGSDFPPLGNGTFSQVFQVKYADATNSTPAGNYITTLYSNNVIRVFVQTVIQSPPLEICSFTNGNGQQLMVNDFVVTSFGSANRLYFGGLFNSVTLAGGNAIPVANFSGQIVVNWTTTPTTGIQSISHVPMTSRVTAQDVVGSGGAWSQVNGVNNVIHCVIDVTGGFGQPAAPSGQKFDNIVIGGGFTGIDANNNRLLRRMAYYDWNYTNTSVTLYTNNSHTFMRNLTDFQIIVGFFTPAQTGTYVNLVCTVTLQTSQFVQNGDTGATVQITRPAGDNINNLVVAHSQTLPVFNGSLTSFARLNSAQLTAGVQYTVWIISSPNTVSYASNNPGFFVGSLTGNLESPTGQIGWRTFSQNWANPVGPDNSTIRGGALFNNSSIGFVHNGTNIITGSGAGTITSNYYFSMNYQAGVPTFQTLNNDPQAIGSLSDQTIWNGNNGHNGNVVTGGNPTLIFGAGNAVGYSEIYLNDWRTNGTPPGIRFRYSPQDSTYVTSSNLIITTTGIADAQLFTQVGGCLGCWRDDSKFPNTYFIAGITETRTATLPWAKNQAPNYVIIRLPLGGNLPSTGFGGYSNADGLVIYTNGDGYVYK